MKIDNIIVEEMDNGTWRADCIDLPGSPPIGTGRNKYEAVGSLIFVLAIDRDFRQFVGNINVEVKAK
jgi:hypothetical protein